MEWIAWIKVISAALFLGYVVIRHRVIAQRRRLQANRRGSHRTVSRG